MILIDEIETVLILTPRTGTKALKKAIFRRYPSAIHLYRHMEADGVPHGYDRWRKVGVVRDPLERLWSLYRYLHRFGLDYATQHNKVFTAKLRASVERPFDDWLINNDIPFTTPYDSDGGKKFYPFYGCRHPIPENRKSQFVYLRPDLGTHVWRYGQFESLCEAFDLKCDAINASPWEAPVPEISEEAQEYMRKWFQWDFEVTGPVPR